MTPSTKYTLVREWRPRVCLCLIQHVGVELIVVQQLLGLVQFTIPPSLTLQTRQQNLFNSTEPPNVTPRNKVWIFFTYKIFLYICKDRKNWIHLFRNCRRHGEWKRRWRRRWRIFTSSNTQGLTFPRGSWSCCWFVCLFLFFFFVISFLWVV